MGGGNLQKVGLAEVLSGVDRVTIELLLDTEELVVLGQTFGAAGGTSLDLTGAETDDDIGDGVVLGLPRAVRDHDAPSGLLGKDGSLFSEERREKRKVNKRHGKRRKEREKECSQGAQSENENKEGDYLPG